MSPPPRLISVILSTFNAPDWLEKSLWGYAVQTHRDFEIVVADDGSGPQTSERIESMRRATGLRIRHVWHPNEGFRKCAILNRGIAEAAGDYLVFSDGDCIPRSDFLTRHANDARPGRFLSGGYVKLPMDLSVLIGPADIQSGRAFEIRWLHQNGMKPTHRWLRLAAGTRTAAVLNRLTTTRATWNGNNSSGWKADLVAAGGFDERMGYGGEDRELGERLVNAGLRGHHVRFQTVCLHLDHARGYVDPARLRINRSIRSETVRSGRKSTEFGLAAA